MGKNRTLKLLKKLHKWPAIIIATIAILFAISGIFLNHRGTFSSIDVSRNLLPSNYTYSNWNLAAVRGSIEINDKETLIYGNIGIWKTNDDFETFQDFNQGFPKGIDNRKIYSVIQHKNVLFAGTQLGLYRKEFNGIWEKMNIPVREDRIADLALKNDTLLVLTRHYLLQSSNGINFETIQLPAPVNYVRKTGLFNTFWQLHSGELFGLPGKLLVDLLGIVTIFLSLTGLLHFFFPKIIRRKKKQQKDVNNLIGIKNKNLRWHNVVGYIFVLFLVINTFAGMHLRPPILIAIANKQVGIIPGTHMDNPNPWFDKLRRVDWNETTKQYLFSTSEGFFFGDKNLSQELQPASSQPPVSIMGCNVLKSIDDEVYAVGSFSGMFLWNIKTGAVADFFTRQPHVAQQGMARPVGANMVAGLVEGKQSVWWFDFSRGAIGLESRIFPEMENKIRQNSPMSLWNASLEIHTGRIFEHLLGPFYILYVPIAGICVLLVLISGFFLWWKMFRKK